MVFEGIHTPLRVQSGSIKVLGKDAMKVNHTRSYLGYMLLILTGMTMTCASYSWAK